MSEPAENMYIPDPLAGRYAGFWRRCAAACIDLILYSPVYLAVKSLLGPEHGTLGEIGFAVIALGSYAVFFASKLQASPGMYIMQFHVTDDAGQRISFKRAVKWGIISSIGMMVCCVSIFYMDYRFNMNEVNQLMISCTEQNLRIEDCIAEAETMIGIPYQTFAMMAAASLILTIFLLLIWSLSVALAKDKTGFHNLICHTRFLKGRP